MEKIRKEIITMLFDYAEFIQSSKESQKESFKEVYDSWKAINGNLNIKEEKYYKYLKKFKPMKYRMPKEMESDFDWDLLLALVACSFSSSYDLILPNPEFIDIDEDIDLKVPDLVIYVEGENQKIAKKIVDLWSFQIKRLFEIYCSEQINYCKMILDDENEELIVNSIKDDKIQEYNIKKQELNNRLKRRFCFED